MRAGRCQGALSMYFIGSVGAKLALFYVFKPWTQCHGHLISGSNVAKANSCPLLWWITSAKYKENIHHEAHFLGGSDVHFLGGLYLGKVQKNIHPDAHLLGGSTVHFLGGFICSS